MVVLATLAIVLAWLCVALVIGGCGFLVRRALIECDARGLAPVDLWLGLAAVLVCLLVWSVFLRVSVACWAIPLAAGIAGLALGLRAARRRVRWPHLVLGAA